MDIKVTKKVGVTTFQQIYYRVIAVIIAFILSIILILLAGSDPLHAFYNLFINPLSYATGRIEIIKYATVLCIITLGILFAFKMKFWNIGAEGQVLTGAVGATFFAINLPNLPPYLLLPIMFIASFVLGGFFGFIPGFFKARFNANETLFTLLLNYIALDFVSALESGVWKDPNAYMNVIAPLTANARLPVMGHARPWSQFNTGFVIAVILVIITYFYINRTKSGYEISVIGESENTARYAGMNVRKIIMKTMIISGGVCGIAGFVLVSGNNFTLSSTITGGIGFTAIIIAWLSKLNVASIPIVALLFSLINVGKIGLEAGGIPSACADAIQALILLCILGCEYFFIYDIKIKFTLFGKGGAR